MTKLNALDKNELEVIISRLVEIYKPKKIYLFGSYAWGNPHQHSDFDIAVIVEKSNESAYLRPQRGTLALWDLDHSIDLIIFTQDEFYLKSEHPSNLQHKIFKDGNILYEAA